MARFITLTAMIAMLAALWLAAAAVGPTRTRMESAGRIARPGKLVALTREFHYAVFLAACEKFEPTIKIFRPAGKAADDRASYERAVAGAAGSNGTADPMGRKKMNPLSN